MTEWQMRMVGGPYDGVQITRQDERPSFGYRFASAPSEWIKPLPSASSFADGEISLPSLPPIIEYRLVMFVRDAVRNVAVYAYWNDEVEMYSSP